ncbi:MerR family transcriptional regulator [Oscillospiraceae bacterium PP1C4]
MDMERLTVGQMARLNNISEQTLRLYDRKNLLKPLQTDEQNGYRYYSITQSARLDMIQYMKSYGMTLQQIKIQLDRCDTDAVKTFLKIRFDNIDHQIEELRRSQKAIGRTLENYHRYETLPKDDVIFIEYMRERKIYKYHSEVNFFDHNYATYEYMLRELKSNILCNDLSMTYFCNVGTIMRKENVVAGRFVSNEIFVFVDDDYTAERGIEILPANTYLSICCNDFYKERQYAGRLIDYALAHNYKIAGDYICEVIAEFPIFDRDQRNMFYKMQVPICLT